MADAYIDLDETQIYGPLAAKRIRTVVAKLVPKYDPALLFIAGELESATKEVGKLLGSTRDTDAERSAGVRKKQPLLQAARELLIRFSKHLDTHKKGELVRKRYLPATASELGRSAPRALLALTHLETELAKKNSPVREAKIWHQEIAAAAAALAPAVAHADSARTVRRDLTPALYAARSAWLSVYQAAKSTVDAVLRITGKLHLLPEVFHDLAVPANAKVTAPPAPAAQKDGTPSVLPPKKKTRRPRKS